MTTQPKITNKQRIREILMVVLTGILKILLVDILDVKFVYIVSALSFWIVYFIYKTSKSNELVKYWGLSFSNSKQTFKIVGIIGLIFFICIVIYGTIKNEVTISLNFVFILLTYPVWGLIQQYLMMSLIAGNIKDYEGNTFSDMVIIIFTSIIFAMVHYPSLPLIIATFFLSIFYSSIFLRHRNIIPFGIFHGVLGGAFYYFIIDRDPWLEFIKIVNQ
jgi:uncharacterized membrane protein